MGPGDLQDAIRSSWCRPSKNFKVFRNGTPSPASQRIYDKLALLLLARALI
jgi:hypothetical protein